MKEWMALFFAAMLPGNVVLARFLGVCPFLGGSKKSHAAAGMGAAVTFVMALAAAACYPLRVLLEKHDLAYLQTVVFVLVIAALVPLAGAVLKRFVKPLHKALGLYLPLITTNCAVLGVVLLNVTETYGFVSSMVNAAGAGAGFLLALVIFAGVRSRMEHSDIPKAFEGLPAALIAASIVSLSFLGFGGIIETIFGV